MTKENILLAHDFYRYQKAVAHRNHIRERDGSKECFQDYTIFSEN
jgi:hypothetical protein